MQQRTQVLLRLGRGMFQASDADLRARLDPTQPWRLRWRPSFFCPDDEDRADTKDHVPRDLMGAALDAYRGLARPRAEREAERHRELMVLTPVEADGDDHVRCTVSAKHVDLESDGWLETLIAGVTDPDDDGNRPIRHRDREWLITQADEVTVSPA